MLMNFIYSAVYQRYYALKRKQKLLRFNGQKVPDNLNRDIGWCEWFFNICWKKWIERFPFRKRGVSEHKNGQEVIVSLTSYPGRIDVVWLAIETLLNQTFKPDRIILWLAESQFPNKLGDLPQNLLVQQNRGLEIHFCDDLRSHKKYFCTMQENPEALVILADDDAFYPRDMIEQLMDLHLKYPEDIISSTVAVCDDPETLPDKWGRPKPDDRILHELNIQPFSGSGTLYPPHCLDEEYFLNRDLIMNLCPNADDLWLFYMASRVQTRVSAVIKERSMPVFIYGTGVDSLWQINGLQRGNDVQWSAIMDYFKALQ